ncbi:MAG TPA: prolyl-tRNA editing protein [Firmicutes bacterium]|jgi:prolyl-tRNA editing enzyme YbaK/EbsC (Cys-tRNA(Pro) deacylase)|nr:prolyl-tRNA editing protein [Bacillota bacterium]
MSLESVKKQFRQEGLPLTVVELETSSATVELAAKALDVEPGRIAKTMALRLKDQDILILAKGDVRIDNRKFKEQFNEKAKFIETAEVLEVTGHPVGGVCPFGLKRPLPVYLDKSLQIYNYVYPAGGSPNSAVKIDLEYLKKITHGEWVDVCKEKEPEIV